MVDTAEGECPAALKVILGSPVLGSLSKLVMIPLQVCLTSS